MSGSEVNLRVELGRQWLSAEDVAKLDAGSVIELRSTADSDVDIYVGGDLRACGELVTVDSRLGVRVVRLSTGSETNLRTSKG